MNKILIFLCFIFSLSFSSEKYSCGTKKYCKEMKSCKEAQFYFKKCGISKLDKDGDGIPCENVCK